MEDRNKSGRNKFRSRLKFMIEQLRDHIIAGTYKPGEFLPSESELVQQYGLSNKSVRKGLDELVAEGLIVKVNRVGSKVTEKGHEATVVTLGVSSSIEKDLLLSRLLDDFNVLYPHIRVKILTITMTDYTSQIESYLENGLIDVFTLNSLHFQELAERGALDMLEPLKTDREIYPFLNEVFRLGPLQYAAPVVFSPIVLAYNRAHFSEAQVPEPDGSWTWEDALEHAETLSKSASGRLGLYFIMVSALRWPVFLMQSGQDIGPDPSGKFSLEGSKLLESMRLCKRIIKAQDNYLGFLIEDNKDVMDLFSQGKVSMMLASYMSLNELKESPLDFDLSPAPFVQSPASMLHAIGVSMRKTDHVAARLLVEYMASPRAQGIIRRGSNSLPAVRSLNESRLEVPDSINRPSRYPLYREIMATYSTRSRLNLSAEAFDVLGRLLKRYWSDLITEQELCEKVDELLSKT